MQDRLMKCSFYKECSPGFVNRNNHDEDESSSSRGEEAATSTTTTAENRAHFLFGVFLSKNYRSHPSMLEVPSRLFYNNSLESCANQNKVDSLLNWSMISGSSNFPMLFIGTGGSIFTVYSNDLFYIHLRAQLSSFIFI